MFTVRTIDNPKFKNCCLISSECGTAYVIKQNLRESNEAVKLSDDTLPNIQTSSAYRRREGEIDLSKFFKKDDEFENDIAYTNHMFGCGAEEE